MSEADVDLVAVQRIFLIGLSGAGKTTIGHQAASLLGWSFVDTDDLLAERMGMLVGQILLEYGEERFRQLEAEVLRGLVAKECVVIATGGGIVISEANRKLMREHGLTVYLQVSVETSWRRMQETSVHIARPLIAGESGRQRLQELFTKRRSWYEEALLYINTEEDSQDAIAQRLVELVRTHRQK